MQSVEYRTAGALALSLGGLVVAASMLFTQQHRADALPAFAAQTGQPCTACHVGGFGPQLTPFGRAFKITGYTQRGGSGLEAHIPLSAMVMTSFTHVGKDYPADAVPHHYDSNNNPSLDQVSVFIAGGLTSHTGGFIQMTYSNFDNTVVLDNTDLRPYVTTVQAFGNDLTLGVSVNNNPTVQDPYNSTFAWGYPFYASQLQIMPGASSLLNGAFAGNVIGVTAYAWYNEHLYLEAGAYGTQSPWLSARLGTEGGPVSNNLMPYVRGAYEWDWGNNAAWAGFTMLHANINPLFGTGQDSYTDYAIDGGYQFLGTGKHTVTVQGIFVHEDQNLTASSASYNAANGTSVGSDYGLNTINLNAQYLVRKHLWRHPGLVRRLGVDQPDHLPDGRAARCGLRRLRQQLAQLQWLQHRSRLGAVRQGQVAVAPLGQSEDRRRIHVLYRLQRRQLELRRLRAQRRR